MTEIPPPETIGQPQSRFDVSTAGQWMAIVIGVAYIAGFVTVNIYLSKLGLRGFDLFRVQYLSAGGAIIFSLAVFYLFCGNFIDSFESSKANFQRNLVTDGVILRDPETVATLVAVSFIAVGAVAASILISSLFFGFSDPGEFRIVAVLTTAMLGHFSALVISKDRKRSRLSVFLVLTLNILMVAVYMFTMTGVHQGVFRVFAFAAMTLGFFALGRGLTQDKTSLFRMPGTWIGAFGFATATFSIAYADISPAYGGGRPDRVTIFLSKEGVPDGVRNLLLAQGSLSAEVDLLAETPGEIIVRPFRGPIISDVQEPVVRLDRKLVAAISKR